jgi:hypothetical protein
MTIMVMVNSRTRGLRLQITTMPTVTFGELELTEFTALEMCGAYCELSITNL